MKRKNPSDTKRFTSLIQMPSLDTADSIAAATIVMLGGSALGVLFLALERYTSRHLVHRITGWCSLGLVVATVVMGLVSGTLLQTAAVGVLASCSILAFAMRSEAVWRWGGFAFQPAMLWALVLIGSLGIGYGVTQGTNEAYVPPAGAAVGSNYHPVLGFSALTDDGRPLSLFEYDEDATLAEAELATLGVEKYRFQIIRLAAPNVRCNCHGWVYTGGQFAIRSRDVPALLEDNGYEEVARPEAGDIVIYRTSSGECAHTGLVRMAGEDELTLVESKWGPLGVYLHPIAAQPYGDNYQFYRSSREGHLVTVGIESDSELARANTLMNTPKGQSSGDSIEPLPSVPARQHEIYDRPIVRVPGQRKA